jgi:cystathionine beta-synthase
MYYKSILETIGNTPLVKLNKVVEDIPALVLAKVETFNPGHSVKDRMALKMILDAEEAGQLKPGGTIIECTSGNTGMGIAIAAAVKGYKCIFTTSDKQSQEKFDLLKAFGAEVIVCPTNVSADDPRSYYSVAERINKEIPNSYWCNQYDNLSNRLAHYESTGPEIWEQTKGKITHLIVGVGTGGTISGTGKYLKEKNPNIQIWGIDTYGSALKKYHETGEIDPQEIYPYITEGIGEDIIPKNVDFSVIDHFEKVSDKDGAVLTRQLAREEGILLGYSAGSALGGLKQLKDRLTKDDVVVIIFHDHGSRYVGKVFNDDWMRERGFLETDMTLQDLIRRKTDKRFITVSYDDPVNEVLKKMKSEDFSQIPVIKGESICGSISESRLLAYLLEDPITHGAHKVGSIMDDAFPELKSDISCKKLAHYLNKQISAVIVRDKAGMRHIITQYDLIHAL